MSSSRGTARLRLLLAELIADNVKAYDLPTPGERLGLASGTEAEAMSSKRVYIGKRPHRRLLESVDNIPPAEAEHQYYAAADNIDMAA